jgi:hypothetical protein
MGSTDNNGESRIPKGTASNFKNQSRKITADVDDESNCVLVTMGVCFGGIALLVKNNNPIFIYRLSNQPKHLTIVEDSKILTRENRPLPLTLNMMEAWPAKVSTSFYLWMETKWVKEK